jgi:hypothetical protein
VTDLEIIGQADADAFVASVRMPVNEVNRIDSPGELSSEEFDYSLLLNRRQVKPIPLFAPCLLLPIVVSLRCLSLLILWRIT